jgi:hypothetical protein
METLALYLVREAQKTVGCSSAKCPCGQVARWRLIAASEALGRAKLMGMLLLWPQETDYLGREGRLSGEERRESGGWIPSDEEKT